MSNHMYVVEVAIENETTLKFRRYNGGRIVDNAYDNLGVEDTETFSAPVDLFYVAWGDDLTFNEKSPLDFVGSSDGLSYVVVNDGCLKIFNWHVQNGRTYRFKLNMKYKGKPIQSHDPIIVNKPNGG